MSEARERFIVEIGGKRWSADFAYAHDVSIALDFNGAQPNFFGVVHGTAAAVRMGSFVGDVRRGGSCNCFTHTLTPHCNGTHTECVGHVTRDPVSIRDIAVEHLLPALLVTVAPESIDTSNCGEPISQPHDRVITRTSLQIAAAGNARDCHALVVRTLPNERDKISRQYSFEPAPPYFSVAAMQWIVEQGIRHLVVDLPSVDRAQDEGRLAAHRIFWGLAAGAQQATAALRGQCTITELAYIDDSIADGTYLLNLQVPPFAADAAPSRPILYPLKPELA